MSTRRRATLAVAAVALTMAAACSGGAIPTATPQPALPTVAATPVPPTPAPTPSPTVAASVAVTPAPTPPPTPSPSPTPVAVSLDASVWFAGFAIHVTGAQYDPVNNKLTFDSTWTNSGTGQIDTAYAAQYVTLAWNGQFIPANVTGGPAPAGATVRAPIDVSVPAGFTPDGAVLTFGQPDQHQALVPLVGGSAQSEQPVQIPVTASVKVGPYVTFSVTGGELVPAACQGSNEKLTFAAVKKTEMSIVLQGSVTNQDPTYDALIDQGFVRVPDGTTGASTPGMNVYVASRGTVRGESMCFDVPAPGTGAFVVTLHETRSGKSATLKLNVP